MSGTIPSRTISSRAAAPVVDETPPLLAEITAFLLQTGEIERAGEVLEALTELRGGHPTTTLLSGQVAFAAGRYNGAEKLYRQLVEDHPEHELGRAFLAESLIAQRRFREAEDLLSTVRRDPPAVRFAEGLVEGLQSGLFQQSFVESRR